MKGGDEKCGSVDTIARVVGLAGGIAGGGSVACVSVTGCNRYAVYFALCGPAGVLRVWSLYPLPCSSS